MHRLTRHRPWARLAATAATAWAVTGSASLATEAGRVAGALAAGDLEAARRTLPSLKSHRPDRPDGLYRGPAATTPRWSRIFTLLQKNMLDRQRWPDRSQLRLAIVTWIERTYHRRRWQRALRRLTPIEYETINSAALAA